MSVIDPTKPCDGCASWEARYNDLKAKTRAAPSRIPLSEALRQQMPDPGPPPDVPHNMLRSDLHKGPPSPPASPDLREALAALCHEQWSGWMRYLFGKTEPHGIGTTRLIPAWATERWRRQMETPYADLSPEEKESDRKEADKFLALLAPGRTREQKPDWECAEHKSFGPRHLPCAYCGYDGTTSPSGKETA